MHNNLATVQKMYACFGQGDIPGILALMADNVRLSSAADPVLTPIGGVFQDKAGAVQYFNALGSTAQTTYFDANNFREEGNQVINDVRHDGIVRATGKSFVLLSTFTWTFNDKGEAVDWVASGDFSSLNEAFKN